MTTNLNRKQFWRQERRGGGRLVGTSYDLVGPNPDFPIGDSRASYMQARTYNQSNVEDIVHPSEPLDRYASPNKVDAYNDLHAPLGDAQGNVQQRLFGYSRQPNATIVEGLYSTKANRAMVPTMLGLIAQDTAREFGPRQPVVPSHNLSQHSGRIVDRLVAEGKAPDPGTRFNNSIDFEDQPKYWHEEEGAEQVSAEQVEAARKFGREEVVGRRPPRDRQERLF